MSVKVLDREELRKEFELCALFEDSFNEETGASLVIDDNGRYASATIQAAWVGFQMYAAYAHAMLKRYSPDRSLPIGMLSEYRAEIAKRILLDETEAHDPRNYLRAALAVAGDTPV